MMKWIDPCEMPKSSMGEVAAVQLARTPYKYGSEARGAKCCLRTPRPHLKQGGDWRKTFVKLHVPHPAYPDSLWFCSLKLWNWSSLRSPQGPMPFPGFQIRWIITVFVTISPEKVQEVAFNSTPAVETADDAGSGRLLGGCSASYPNLLDATCRAIACWDEF